MSIRLLQESYESQPTIKNISLDKELINTSRQINILGIDIVKKKTTDGYVVAIKDNTAHSIDTFKQSTMNSITRVRCIPWQPLELFLKTTILSRIEYYSVITTFWNDPTSTQKSSRETMESAGSLIKAALGLPEKLSSTPTTISALAILKRIGNPRCYTPNPHLFPKHITTHPSIANCTWTYWWPLYKKPYQHLIATHTEKLKDSGYLRFQKKLLHDSTHITTWTEYNHPLNVKLYILETQFIISGYGYRCHYQLYQG